VSPGSLALLARSAAALALALLAVAGIAWAARQPRFDLHRIEVRGDLRHVSRAQVRSAIAGRAAGGWFTVRLDRVRAAFETIPWVAAASVRRVWPDRLEVELVERRAVGAWDDGRLLAQEGVLFAGNADEAELDGPQVQFSGPPGYAPLAGAGLAGWKSALAAMGTNLAAVEISERGSWTLRAGSGQVIELGRDDPPGTLGQRLSKVAASYPVVVAQVGGAPARIDARYGNGFTVSGP